MTPEELNAAIAAYDDLNRGHCEVVMTDSLAGKLGRIFPHLVARIRELEAQRPKAHLYCGNRSKLWHWGLLEPEKHAWDTEAEARAEAKSYGFEVIE